jgi:CRISPR-associated endoribonuclease Cas2 subtype I-E
MIIIIGKHIPSRIRGILQLWLIEPKPNVFIGDVNKVIENKIIEFIQPYLNINTDIMIIRNAKNIQGFIINYAINSENTLITNNALLFNQHKDNLISTNL